MNSESISHRAKGTNLGILCPGNSVCSGLEALLRNYKEGDLLAKPVAIFCDGENVNARKYSEEYKVPLAIIKDQNTPEQIESHALDFLGRMKVDLIALSGYERRISRKFIDRYNGNVLNIHPSLLPAFGGKGMYGLAVHEAVIKSGTFWTGATVHFVREEYDSGPILLQIPIKVSDTYSPEDLQRVVKVVEHKLYTQAINLLCSGRKFEIINNRVVFI